jgi:hypothetical protein
MVRHIHKQKKESNLFSLLLLLLFLSFSISKDAFHVVHLEALWKKKILDEGFQTLLSPFPSKSACSLQFFSLFFLFLCLENIETKVFVLLCFVSPHSDAMEIDSHKACYIRSKLCKSVRERSAPAIAQWLECFLNLPSREPRFILYNFQFESGSQIRKRIVPLFWTPRAAHIADRVLYLSCPALTKFTPECFYVERSVEEAKDVYRNLQEKLEQGSLCTKEYLYSKTPPVLPLKWVKQ